MHRIRSRASLALASSLLFTVIACGGGDDAPAAPSVNVPFSQTDLSVGTGAEAVSGRRVSVNYTGWLYDPNAPRNEGSRFDTSIGRGPFAFTLGRGEVIAGWDQGIAGMRVGGRRRLVIPPSLGYGAQGMPPVIPPNATLLFEVELLDVS
jgi:FKBP-type peptidyl-prolyl cis-trans isomerase FkpA